MKKALKTIAIILCCILVLAAALAATAEIAYRHHSDRSSLKQYQTTNPHINETTYISAHRSGAGIMPEETLMAFSNCLDNPAFEVDYFEFDLHITKDDVLVLLHDHNLDRTSDSEKVFGVTEAKPEDYTFEELRKLNMGAKFVTESGEMPYKDLSGDEVPDELRILSLDMILDYLESRGHFRYIIEIKNEGDLGKRGVDILYQALTDRDMLDRVVFGSFVSEVSEYKDEKYPDFMRGAFPSEVIDFYLASLTNRKNYSPKFAVIQAPYHVPSDKHVNLGTTSILNYAHAHNLAVQYWTINDEEDMEYLISIGADCIMSDYPDKAYQVWVNFFTALSEE